MSLLTYGGVSISTYVVHSTFIVPIEKAEEVVQIYRTRSRSVDTWPGFVSFKLLQNEHHPDELTVQIEFKSKEDYLAWVQSEQYKQIHELEKKYPDKELANIVPRVRKYQVVAQ